MPITPTYPGVYIEEIPSGVRTITGVATSITAFIGSALRGPDDEPVIINNYGDFERIFGGLWVKSNLGYAVRDFYANGGSQAIIVRLYNPDPGKPEATPAVPAPPAQATLTVGSLNLVAAYKGAWGSNLRARIDYDVNPDDNAAKQFGADLTHNDLFNLTVRDTGAGGITEQFRNLTVKNSSRRVDNVLKNSSQLVRATGTFPGTTIPTASPTPAAGSDPWSDANSSKVTTPASDGINLTYADNFVPVGAEANKKGLYALLKADIFNLLYIPFYKDTGVDTNLIADAAKFCENHRAFLIIDSPPNSSKDSIKTWVNGLPTKSNHVAVFFPTLLVPNPLRSNQVEEFGAGGVVAGIFARTDAQRGIWKAPAGLETTLVGVPQLSVPLTNQENGELNPLGINSLRAFPGVGRVVWGSRTLQGDDRLASEWKYIPVRRLALYIEESLYRGTQWVVFEPNDEPLWSQIRLNIGAFMNNLFRQGAFQGKTPQEAYFVKCSSETTTQNDINLGIVNIVVGFAPLKPAEFVILKIQQIAGSIAT
ncbi:phage tail sheath subtilisin-like domain-containing protein [Calothrix sp. PCC 7507]|uniref:phage tail sheath family protein n=1 Tax=Calothrix sp. PCC 7507 TaxID=99598 RepID=UPI00029F2206|nr:phage tail sheath subtilisin-like domain-containing protein [Calothrix sp. PCC 7507]AFY34112.1 putative phage tail sheath protein [Calothrix sp. PCC 7507]